MNFVLMRNKDETNVYPSFGSGPTFCKSRDPELWLVPKWSRPIRSLDFSNSNNSWTVWPFWLIFCIKLGVDKRRKPKKIFFGKITDLRQISIFGPKWPKMAENGSKKAQTIFLLNFYQIMYFYEFLVIFSDFLDHWISKCRFWCDSDLESSENDP